MPRQDLPKDEVHVKGGRVVLVSMWGRWNERPYERLNVHMRPDDTFSGYLSDPERGGRTLIRLKMEEAMSGVEPDTLDQLQKLFALENITNGLPIVPLLGNEFTRTEIKFLG